MGAQRKLIIAGNWKMNKTSLEAIDLANALLRELGDVTEVDIMICPPFTALSEIHDVLTDSNIHLGAQNLHWEASGAFTGEISAPMIKSAGAQYVIIGHSERRQYFGETNETVHKRIRSALKIGLLPIVCVGENLQEREEGRTFAVIENHFQGALQELSAEDMQNVTLAYEPVWAIGTGKTATPAQAQEAHQFLRKLLHKMFGEELAKTLRMQYGGSVTPENAVDLLSQEDIDGALVGGASLKPESFVKIVRAALTPLTSE